MDTVRPPTDRGASLGAADGIDLPELLTRVGGAVWPLFADPGSFAGDGADRFDDETPEDTVRPSLAAVDRAFAALPPKLRTMAAVVLDASSAVATGVTLESVLGRMAVLGQGAAGITRSLAHHETDARWVDGLYATLENQRLTASASIAAQLGESSERRHLLAAAIALSGRLPLGLDSAEALMRHEDNALAIAVGEAARAGDPGARAMVRDALAAAQTPGGAGVVALASVGAGPTTADGVPSSAAMVASTAAASADPMLLSLLFGLGEGNFQRGFAELVSLACGAILEPARWGSATLHAAIILCRAAYARPGPHGPSGSNAVAVAASAEDPNERAWMTALLEPLLGALAFVTDADAGVAFLDALPARIHGEFVAVARRELVGRPPAARAAVARAHLKDTLFSSREGDSVSAASDPARSPSAALQPATDLLRERSAPVLLMVLELITRLGDALPSELKTALGRAWSDHPDVAVRRALALSIAPRTAPRPEGEGSAEVIMLPPAALARDDLDRLRAALWAGESERIIELATCVPLDRRGPARESLLLSLEIPNAPLRRSIVEALGRIGGQSDGPRLIDAARRYRALEGTVAAALRELGARAMAEPLAEIYRRRLKWADDDAVDDYCTLAGSEQVMHLMQALETRYYPSARAGAARAIARRRASEVVFALRTAALSDTQDTARMAALGALHELTGSGPSGDEIAGHALLFRSTEDLPDTIERAREAGPAALNGIRRTIARGSWKRRRAACDVLATLPVPEATAVLVEVLEDPDEDVRLAAVEALAQRGWEPSNARETTLHALAARRIRETCDNAAPESIDLATLVFALGLGGHVFRAEVLDALNDIASERGFKPTPEEIGVIAAARMDIATAIRAPRGVEAVLRAVDHTWQANPHRARFVRELANLSSAELAAQLEAAEGAAGQKPTWSWRAREAIAQALERSDDPVALGALGRLVLEDDDDVRRAALQSLAWIGSPAAAEEIARGLQSPFQEDRDLVARALGTFGPRAAQVIGELMADSWWESRQGAALALGHWRSDVQGAVDRLVSLAVDPEYRVAQAAREGLTAHGLLPTTAALCEAIGRAQTLTLEGLEPWLGLHRSPTAPPDIADRLDALIEDMPPDALPQRLGLIATFRAEHLALWLEGVALGHGDSDAAVYRHVGARLAAAEALRTLLRCACPVCIGEGTLRCPGCNGAGDVPCGACQGRGTVMVSCPDPGCTAHGTLRRIDSRRCPTCRGRGEVPAPCACEGGRGRVPCSLCKSGGRLSCGACDGTGNARSAT